MSVPIKIEKCWLKRKGNHFLEHTVPSDLFNFEHVTHVRNNVWENVNIIGDVLIQAYIILRLHFLVFESQFLHTTSVKTKRDNVGLF